MLGDYETFKQSFYQMSDIDLNSYKEGQMKRRIDNFVSKVKADNYIQFLGMIRNDDKLFEDFMLHLTINVSEFYRNPTQWKTLENEIIPELLKKNRKIKIWSAACSTGDEPYTLAMIFSELFPKGQFSILATDLDQDVLKKAKVGRYIDKSIKELPKVYQTKYMKKNEDGTFSVSEELKSCIQFQQHNLLKDEYPKGIDLLVCRNVMIYFTEEAKDEIYAKFAESLNDDCYLFIGSTEQIIGSAKYGLKSIRSFFYQKQK
ncbi:MAG: protein-glutamate O-methyltransferase CheR [Eubacterium sp.]|nr:protein-glutamate O-methyltransferase CheR [Eubacterium sp.]